MPRKKKVGRPPLSRDAKLVQGSRLTFTRVEHDALGDIAAEQDKSVSELVREWVRANDVFQRRVKKLRRRVA